jgi:hypothetical protein
VAAAGVGAGAAEARDERHHRGRRRQHVGSHQWNDDDSPDDRRVHDDRKRDRIPLLASHRDRRLDDIAENLTCQGVSPHPPSRASAPAFLLEDVSNQPARKDADYSQSKNWESTKDPKA